MISCSWKIKQDECQQGGEMNTQDMSEEMGDLMAVYERAHKESSNRAEAVLGSLVYHMKLFVEAYETKIQVRDKLETLKDKLGLNECDECEEGNE